MTIGQSLLPEFDQEMMLTRRLLERVPSEKVGGTTDNLLKVLDDNVLRKFHPSILPSLRRSDSGPANSSRTLPDTVLIAEPR
ncbi:MAG TPA: hypothetical protein VH438_06185 [Gemmatimonadales bacterium]|jgi:hypothetical protein